MMNFSSLRVNSANPDEMPPYTQYSCGPLLFEPVSRLKRVNWIILGEVWNIVIFSQGFSQKVVSTISFVFNSLPPSVDFCCLMITFANSLDPDQASQNVRPDLDPNCLTPGWY